MTARMRHRSSTPLTRLWHCGIVVEVPNPPNGNNFKRKYFMKLTTKQYYILLDLYHEFPLAFSSLSDEIKLAFNKILYSAQPNHFKRK